MPSLVDLSMEVSNSMLGTSKLEVSGMHGPFVRKVSYVSAGRANDSQPVQD